MPRKRRNKQELLDRYGKVIKANPPTGFPTEGQIKLAAGLSGVAAAYYSKIEIEKYIDNLRNTTKIGKYTPEFVSLLSYPASILIIRMLGWVVPENYKKSITVGGMAGLLLHLIGSGSGGSSESGKSIGSSENIEYTYVVDEYEGAEENPGEVVIGEYTKDTPNTSDNPLSLLEPMGQVSNYSPD